MIWPGGHRHRSAAPILASGALRTWIGEPPTAADALDDLGARPAHDACDRRVRGSSNPAPRPAGSNRSCLGRRRSCRRSSPARRTCLRHRRSNRRTRRTGRRGPRREARRASPGRRGRRQREDARSSLRMRQRLPPRRGCGRALEESATRSPSAHDAHAAGSSGGFRVPDVSTARRRLARNRPRWTSAKDASHAAPSMVSEAAPQRSHGNVSPYGGRRGTRSGTRRCTRRRRT